jgi:hypothetical protein
MKQLNPGSKQRRFLVERLRYEVDRQWRGEIPRTMLIGRDGSITTIEGTADMQTVRIRTVKTAAWHQAAEGLGAGSQAASLAGGAVFQFQGRS